MRNVAFILLCFTLFYFIFYFLFLFSSVLSKFFFIAISTEGVKVLPNSVVKGVRSEKKKVILGLNGGDEVGLCIYIFIQDVT